MPASLDEWQCSLAEHFDSVTLKKLYLAHEPVTFAFEHGLDKTARSELRDIVLDGVSQRIFNHDHLSLLDNLCIGDWLSLLGR